MEFAIYSRKSKQTGKGESIQNQIAYCKNYIMSRFGTEHMIHIFSEEGFSAKNQCRPQFQNMMLLAQQKKLDYIVCYRLDRISRNVGDFAMLIEQLSKWDIAFICVQEQFDTSTATGRAMMYMASVFAQLERETIGERVKDNMFYLAKKGYWLGGTFPLGFVSKRITENEHSYCYLVQQQSEIKIVQKMYAFFLEYGSLSEVKRQLEQCKIYSRLGNVFSITAIKEILTNPVYCKGDTVARQYFLEKGADVTFSEKECSDKCGLMVYNKRNYTKKSAPRQNIKYWIVAIGKHQGIISGDVWVSIQKRLQRNSIKNEEHKTENDYALFSGILYCQKCGEKMQAKKRRNHQKIITFDYICKGKLQKKCCNIQNLSGKQTDDEIETLLLDYIEKNNHFCDIWQKWKQQNIQYDNKEWLYCQRQKQNYIDLLAKQNISNILLAEVNQKIEELTSQQYMLQNQKEIWEKNQCDMIDKHTFSDLWKYLTIKQKQEAIRYLIKKGIWNGNTLQIFLNF